MAKFRVTFVQYWVYDVEAEDEEQAEDLAYKEFRSDMYHPTANTHYDDVEIKEVGEK